MYNEVESTSTTLNGSISNDEDNTIVLMQAQKINTDTESSTSLSIYIQNYDKYLEHQKEYDSNIEEFKLRVARL